MGKDHSVELHLLIPIIENPRRFLFTTRELPDTDRHNLCQNTDLFLKRALDFLFRFFFVTALSHLDKQRAFILAEQMIQHKLILAGGAGNALEHFLNLAWKNIDALDLNHIVRAADQGVDPGIFGAACAFSRDKAR